MQTPNPTIESTVDSLNQTKRQARISASNAWQRLGIVRTDWFKKRIETNALIGERGQKEIVEMYEQDISNWYSKAIDLSNAETVTDEQIEELVQAEDRGIKSSEYVMALMDMYKEHNEKMEQKHGKDTKAGKKAFRAAREYARSQGLNINQEDIAREAKVISDTQELLIHGIKNSPMIVTLKIEVSNGFVAFNSKVEKADDNQDDMSFALSNPSGAGINLLLGKIAGKHIKTETTASEAQEKLALIYKDIKSTFGPDMGYDVAAPSFDISIENETTYVFKMSMTFNKYSFINSGLKGKKYYQTFKTDADGVVIDIDSNTSILSSNLQNDENGDRYGIDKLILISNALVDIYGIQIGRPVPTDFNFTSLFVGTIVGKVQWLTDLVVNNFNYGSVKDESTGETEYTYEFELVQRKYYAAFAKLSPVQQDEAGIEADLDNAFKHAVILGEDKQSIQDSVVLDRIEQAAVSAANEAMALKPTEAVLSTKHMPAN